MEFVDEIDLDEVVEVTSLDEFIGNMQLLCHCMHPCPGGWPVLHMEEALQKEYFFYFEKYVKPGMFKAEDIQTSQKIQTWAALFNTPRFKPIFKLTSQHKLLTLKVETPRLPSEFQKIAKMANFKALQLSLSDPLLNILLNLQPLAEDVEDKIEKRIKQIQAVQSDKGLLRAFDSKSQLCELLRPTGIIDIHVKKEKGKILLLESSRKRKLEDTEGSKSSVSDAEKDKKEEKKKVFCKCVEAKAKVATCVRPELETTKDIAVNNENEEQRKNNDIGNIKGPLILKDNNVGGSTDEITNVSSNSENGNAPEKANENVTHTEKRDAISVNSNTQENTNSPCNNSASPISHISQNTDIEQLKSQNTVLNTAQGTYAGLRKETLETDPHTRFIHPSNFHSQYTRRGNSVYSESQGNSSMTSSMSSPCSQESEDPELIDYSYFQPRRPYSLAHMESQYPYGRMGNELLGEIFGLWNTEKPGFNNRPLNVHPEDSGTFSFSIYFNIRSISTNDLQDIFSRYGQVTRARISSNQVGTVEFSQYSQAVAMFKGFAIAKGRYDRCDVWENDGHGHTPIFAFSFKGMPSKNSVNLEGITLDARDYAYRPRAPQTERFYIRMH